MQIFLLYSNTIVRASLTVTFPPFYQVKSEIKKKWERYKLTRSGSGSTNLRGPNRSTIVSTYLSRARNSLYSIQSTADKGESINMTNSYIHRNSVNQANGGTERTPLTYEDLCNGRGTRSKRKDSGNNRSAGEVAKQSEVQPIMSPDV